MEIHRPHKSLKTLERVKGIEPSYSAWKSRFSPALSKRILTFRSLTRFWFPWIFRRCQNDELRDFSQLVSSFSGCCLARTEGAQLKRRRRYSERSRTFFGGRHPVPEIEKSAPPWRRDRRCRRQPIPRPPGPNLEVSRCLIPNWNWLITPLAPIPMTWRSCASTRRTWRRQSQETDHHGAGSEAGQSGLHPDSSQPKRLKGDRDV